MTKRMKRQHALDFERRMYHDCWHKKNYPTQIEADAWGKIMNDRYGWNTAWRSYLCPHCKKFHLTSKQDRASIQIVNQK